LQYLAFDSFEGLPKIAEIDQQPIWAKGRLAMGEPKFKKLCRMPTERLKTIKGFYSDSLTDDLKAQLLPRKASIIYIDCDLYVSTVPVLEFIPDFLQEGTIIALDDWNCFWADPNRGQRKAWAEFCARHPNLHFEPFVSTHGLMSFIHTELRDKHDIDRLSH
jgi:O-methyltransferase